MRRNRAPLLLMEQMVMLLVFALSAALCMQAFVASDALSRQTEARDRAVLAAQSAAEAICWAGGTPEHALAGAAGQLDGVYAEGKLLLSYREDWQPLAAQGEPEAFRLEAQAEEGLIPGLCKAEIVVRAASGEQLFVLETAWQKEAKE